MGAGGKGVGVLSSPSSASTCFSSASFSSRHSPFLLLFLSSSALRGAAAKAVAAPYTDAPHPGLLGLLGLLPPGA